jgi:molecular chaperone DnaK (HSP70)
MNYEKEMVLGIDLGTTFSAVAKWDGKGPENVQNSQGKFVTESVAHYEPSTGVATIGQAAASKTRMAPERGVIGVKRLMDDGSQAIELDGLTRTPIDVSADILKKLIADTLIKVPESRVASSVVTVPYYFKAHQCEHTRRAAELADAKCKRILQEPIAASFDFAFSDRESHGLDRDQTVLVFDLGGGTYDLTVYNSRVTPQKLGFEVLATGGDDRLGGIDFDAALVALIAERAKVDLSKLSGKIRAKAEERLRMEAVEAKIALAVSQSADVILPDIPAANPEIVLTRGDFECAIAGYIETIEALLEKVLLDASVKPSQIDRVIRVGGSSRIPAMKELLDKNFGAGKVWSSPDMDLSVSRGACWYAAFLDDPEVFGREVEIVTRTSHALGIEVQGGKFQKIIRENRKTPCEAKQRFNPGKDGETEIEIAVYQGASPSVAGNSKIGTVKVTGLAPRRALETNIDVTFRVSAEQTLTVIVDVDGRRISDSFTFA